MLNLNRGRTLAQRYRDNEDGNIALSFAVSAVAIIGCMGAAMDYSTLTNAAARSQSIADQTALTAAIYVKDHGREPQEPKKNADGEYETPEDGYLDMSLKTYSAAELGHEYKGWVAGGAENVNVTVEYDDELREARVTVSGKTNPTFMQIFGKQKMDFSATASVKYEEFEFYDPASVIMVLDNSGSMSFDDRRKVWDANRGQRVDQPGAQPRIMALKQHSRSFMKTLKDLVGEQSTNDEKILRTGMLAYAEDTVAARTVNMDWKTVTNSEINSMVANGGTNSAPPLDTARQWMESEDQTHINMHGEKPLKFVIFMTDGVNSVGGVTWKQEEDTGQWRGIRCYRDRYGRCYYYYWDTVEQENRPSDGWYWTEGRYVPTANIQSVEDCDAMKADGVKIYAIGFALAEGWYDTNGYFMEDANDEANRDREEYNDTDTRNEAYSFLSACASEPSTFLTAENAEELKQAFVTIGNDIQTEIIRLSN